MRIQPLSASNAGMTRLRSKGGPSPETLYDLLNGYIRLDGTMGPRFGTQTDITLPADTKGLVAHKCKQYVFKHEPDVTSDPANYVVATIRHPTDSTILLQQIHFAAPFMGWLYVAAEFADGNTWHYWLEELDAWSANTDYKEGDRVFASVEDGYAYKATRISSPNPVWTANALRSVADIIEPTVANGFKYTVIAVTGDSPQSGSLEPVWPDESGAQIIEYAHGDDANTTTTTTFDPDPNVGDSEDIQDGRYDNPAGGFDPPLKKPSSGFIP